uniref:Phosducin thioredoxin-like domain-containing protein n=1 Tax=Meloidogyne incognita TaxID=6306 RepID=A0A914LEX9_MELIC
MTNFEEKFLDGPNVGYCSSSDDEHTVPKKDQVLSKNYSKYQKTERTGPKGVLADYQLSEQEKFIEQRAKEAALLKEATRFTLKNPPDRQEEEDEEEEIELKRIRERRVEQLKSRAKGQVVKISDRFEFLNLIEQQSPDDFLFILIHLEGNERCEHLNSALLELSGFFNNQEKMKFYKIESIVLGTTNKFTKEALPVLQIYKAGQLIGNFICLDKEMNEDYDGQDLLKFLKRNGISFG